MMLAHVFVGTHPSPRWSALCGRAPRVCSECLGLCMDILDVAAAPDASEPIEEPALPEDSEAELEQMYPALFTKNEELDAQHVAPAMSASPPSDCSFCGARQSEVEKLIAGSSTVGICDGCAVADAEIVAGSRA